MLSPVGLEVLIVPEVLRVLVLKVLKVLVLMVLGC